MSSTLHTLFKRRAVTRYVSYTALALVLAVLALAAPTPASAQAFPTQVIN